MFILGWKAGLVVRSTYYSYRRPRFCSQHSCGCSQLLVTRVPHTRVHANTHVAPIVHFLYIGLIS